MFRVRRFDGFVSGILVLGLLASGVSADVPRLVHYQGKLRDTSGVAFTGTVGLRFRLYDDATSSSTVLFDESHATVGVSSGLFSVLLGSATPGGVPDSALDVAEVYLGVTINGGSELSPRTRIGSTAHALKARSSEQLVRPGTFTAAVTVDGSGNVGVGTASPGGKLDVNGSLVVGGSLSADGSVGTAGQILKSQGAGQPPTWGDPPSSSTFGGTGADGDLIIASGVTTLDLGGAALFSKNYASISITGTGQLKFSNPNTAGTLIVLRSKGDVTVTSSANPSIDASAMGAAGGGGGAAGTSGAGGSGGGGTNANYMFDASAHGGTGGGGGNGSICFAFPTAGPGGAALSSTAFYTVSSSSLGLFNGNIVLAPGSGGAGGGGGGRGSTGGCNGGAGGAGGRGGGALYIEVGGSLNFTSTMSVAGQAGSRGGDTCGTVNNSGAGAGGGGGGGGMALVLYRQLTANTGTISFSGGGGGGIGNNLNWTNSNNACPGSGGGGGGGYAGGGGNGSQTSGNNNGGPGGGGANGAAAVLQKI